MVAGHLQQKNGYWYMVLSYHDTAGKRVSKWKATHLKERGNKKRAEELLANWRWEYTSELLLQERSSDIYFDSYLAKWLEQIKTKVAPSTYSTYSSNIRSSVIPYFGSKNILIANIEPRHLAEYYDSLLKRGLSTTSVHRYHANIHNVLTYAVADGLIQYNPADRVATPRDRPYVASFYSTEECKVLLSQIHGSEIELPVTLTLLLGLRRSEVLGLKWEAIDFVSHVIHIKNSILEINGEIIERDILKRKSSHRTLPMPEIVEKLLCQLSKQSGYVCIDRNGNLIRPNALSRMFKRFLKMNKLPEIRYHDLRHTCAAVLLTAQTPIIEVSRWLGHSTLRITADLYGHLEFASKIQCASVLTEAFKLEGDINE